MSSGQIFILCIIFLVFGMGIVKQRMRLQEKRPHDDPQYQSRINALEERVKTLERIVTDKGYDLKREFDKL
jgi:hypothetical protein